MPLPACFHLADDVFPRVRAEASRRLVAKGWSQSQIAAELAVSQAMVSKYAGRTEPETDALVHRLTDELLHDLGGTQQSGGSAWCNTLAPARALPGADEALQDILAAEKQLLDQPPMAMIPQIGLNITRCVDNPKTSEDVLAFPGRMVAAGNRLVTPLPPAWGGSQHLASCLLALRASAPDQFSLANVRATPKLLQAVLAAGHQITTLERNGDASEAPTRVAFEGGATLLHDPGAIGIEPCLYIAGPTATQVATTIQSINHRLNQ